MINPIFDISFWFLIKIGVLTLLLMYLVFAIIVVRQIKLMTDTLTLGYEGVIKMLGFVHLAFTVLVILTALIIL